MPSWRPFFNQARRFLSSATVTGEPHSRTQECSLGPGSFGCRSAFYSQNAATVPLRKQLKKEAEEKWKTKSDGSSPDPPAACTNLDGWELTVGIEIHAQLNAARKLFSKAATTTNDTPNSHVALFDVATPGSLPLFQEYTLIPALRAAIALGCTIQSESRFDRKHYYYHDQPTGYQLTQYYRPLAKGGSVTLTSSDGIGPQEGSQIRIGIEQVQMEQDTAKSQASDGHTTLVDYNRAGQPLIEIISLPEIHSPEAAAAYVRKIQSILLSVNAVTTGMEMGGLRADVNVSVRRRDRNPKAGEFSQTTGLGQRTEIKNLSTFKGVEAAIKTERDRQIRHLESGGTIDGETRGWSLAAPSITRKLRGKEGSVDYRYMPDADISPVLVGTDLVEHLQKTLPILPDQYLRILTEDMRYSLSLTDAKILQQLDDGKRLEYYFAVVDGVADLCDKSDIEAARPRMGQLAANWVMHELGSLFTTAQESWQDNRVPPGRLASILANLLRCEITSRSAKQILKLVYQGDDRHIDVIIGEGSFAFHPLSEDEYIALASAVIADQQDIVMQIRKKGKTGKVMFLVGQMLRRGEEGRMEAQKAESVLRRLIA